MANVLLHSTAASLHFSPIGLLHSPVSRPALQIPAAKSSLETSLPELFDVLSCYFPVTFTPPPNNVHGITRSDLASALEAALACCPLYANQLVPLALEKLSSNLR